MYATVQHMTDRFGETEIIRLSNPEDRTAETVAATRVETALRDATSIIDSYLRRHYKVPVATPPEALVRATCIIARHDLAISDRSEPSESMIKANDKIISWLKQIADNVVSLEVPKINEGTTSTAGSGARFSDRPQQFSNDSLKGW